ncbi:MAG: phosphoribosylanthranilate isomerase [Prevotella sp.]|nr:phosphoribosylanthranilate isomerase [Prevotella sp.]
MIIKVCGMRDAENIRAVEQIGVDWIGFIFWQDSPRYVKQINSRAGIIPDYPSLKDGNDEIQCHRDVKRVGVFVDDMPQNIVTRVFNFKLDIIQLHGSENTVMIDNLRRTLDPDIKAGIKIIKALNISTLEDVEKTREYEGHVDYFLFDTKTLCKGGSGEKFNWSLLNAYNGNVPFLLSGGIGPDDVDVVKAFKHPMFVGIDLNSRFETAPAVKDVDLIKKFISQL